MEGGESVLDTLFDDESNEDAQDIEMLDVEEGELTEEFSKAELVESSDVGLNQVNQESGPSNLRHKKKRKRNKQKGSSSSGPNVTDVNRFVLDVCKRLREKKSYLVWTAVGCLGVSALSDLIKEACFHKFLEIPNRTKLTVAAISRLESSHPAECTLRYHLVNAIQACGGQKTADGRRSRNGGGILWNIIKSRDPNAYKEIMKKGKEFEKQFKQQFRNNQEPTTQQTDDSSKKDQIKSSPSDGLDLSSHDQKNQLEHPTSGQKRTSVHNRIRLPVSYDDLLTAEDTKDEPKQLDL